MRSAREILKMSLENNGYIKGDVFQNYLMFSKKFSPVEKKRVPMNFYILFTGLFADTAEHDDTMFAFFQLKSIIQRRQGRMKLLYVFFSLFIEVLTILWF